MFSRLSYQVCFALVLGLVTGIASADIETGLVGYWPLDEGAGTTVGDASGRGHNGFFAEGTPEWVEGMFGKALKFDGVNKVEIPDHPDFHPEDAVSIALWAKPEAGQLDWGKLFCRQASTGEYLYKIDYDSSQQIRASVTTSSGSFTASPRPPNFPGEWGHLCLTYDGSAVILYKDGEEVARIAASGKLQQDDVSLSIGGRLGSGQNFTGIIDDVRLFSHALTVEEIQQVMQGPPSGPASNPSPSAGAQDVLRETSLSWTPGEFAAAINGHIFYLSETFKDVNDGIGGIAQSETSYTPAQRLNFNTTYYWRVDEVSAPPDSVVYPGDVWSFTTEPVGYPVDGANITATASSAGQADFGPEKTINGSGLDVNDLHSTEPTDMWISGNEPLGAWIQYEFNTVYKLHEMWIWNSNQALEAFLGFGFKEVTVEYSTNGTDWTALAGVPEFTWAPGTEDYAHDTTVDLAGAVAKYVKLTASSNWGGALPQYGLSEVRFFAMPMRAREPLPDTGTVDVGVDATLHWRAGREAATHNVYLSSDQQAVIDGNVPSVGVTDPSYSINLDLGNAYYWRVDEVNEAETPTTWQGDVWSFSTPEYLVVDDFESYNDIDPPNPESHRIFESWVDGYDIATNGALVGYDPPQPSYTETMILHSGTQAMPLFYSNTAGAMYSEATHTFAPAQDWTKHGIQTLVLYFQGISGNTGQLYLKVNGVKVSYPGDAADIERLRWNQWNIDLASLGVNLTNITTLTLGMDGNDAAGTLYIDDIVLYRLAPAKPSEEIYIEAEAANPLGASWRAYTDPLSSGGAHIGSEDGDGSDNDTAPGAEWLATYSFNAAGGTYKVLLRGQEQGSDSFWVRITTATAQTHENPDQPGTGWVKFNGLDAPNGWAWDEVHSNDHDNEVVTWTLPAGANTIEIAKREDGVWLDAILIVKTD